MAEHSVTIIIILILMWLVTLIIFIRQTIYVKSLDMKLIETYNRLRMLEGDDGDLAMEVRDMQQALNMRGQRDTEIADLVDHNFKIITSSFDVIDERFREARVKSDRIDKSLKMLMEV